MTDPKSGVSRRTVLKGAAWSVPVVAVTTAVPAQAASGDVNVGQFNESSANITNQTVSMSGMYVDCTDGQTSPMQQPYTATVTISYTGSNPDFTFVPTVNQSPGWAMTVTDDQIVLTATQTPNGCGEGSAQFPPIALSFNQSQADPGPDSISIQGVAVSEDGQYVISPLVDQTPCSPTFGQSPIVGPREIPPNC
ncbi:hypothetical protein ACFVAE_00605 [Microbacterium sp. NPDC057659]|uniref:hypothetical protein n=1 Tax=Microbacterium sp. NPDC057659 TaxID=3346198 RepID=UPI00366FDB1A